MGSAWKTSMGCDSEGNEILARRSETPKNSRNEHRIPLIKVIQINSLGEKNNELCRKFGKRSKLSPLAN